MADEEWLSLRSEIGLVDARLHEVLEGIEESRDWPGVASLIERRRRLIDTERRLIAVRQRSLTIAEAMALANSIVAILQTHIRDKTLMSAIAADLELLLEK